MGLGLGLANPNLGFGLGLGLADPNPNPNSNPNQLVSYNTYTRRSTHLLRASVLSTRLADSHPNRNPNRNPTLTVTVTVTKTVTVTVTLTVPLTLTLTLTLGCPPRSRPCPIGSWACRRSTAPSPYPQPLASITPDLYPYPGPAAARHLVCGLVVEPLGHRARRR